jgi:hypothetical protein
MYPHAFCCEMLSVERMQDYACLILINLAHLVSLSYISIHPPKVSHNTLN